MVAMGSPICTHFIMMVILNRFKLGPDEGNAGWLGSIFVVVWNSQSCSTTGGMRFVRAFIFCEFVKGARGDIVGKRQWRD